MKTLIIMRHAKSSWVNPGQDDHARPLNVRGRASAQAIGEWLSFGGFVPDEVLSSDATRTRETWENLKLDGSPLFSRTLYLAPSSTYLAALREAHGDCVMVLGHNPGIADFAHQMLREPPVHERFDDYPTAATLVGQIDCDWEELEFGKAIARAFTVPRDLID